jgi:hypothetical protein
MNISSYKSQIDLETCYYPFIMRNQVGLKQPTMVWNKNRN